MADYQNAVIHYGLGKILRPGRRDLCAGQVQTVYPTASTVQRGTQAEIRFRGKNLQLLSELHSSAIALP